MTHEYFPHRVLIAACYAVALISLVNKSLLGQETVVYSFPSLSNPTGGLVMDSAGNLYGTTGGDDCVACGTVFRLNAAGGETVLHRFAGGADGSLPRAGLLLDSAGNLYGTTSYGGLAAQGVVFKLNASGDETVLYRFSGGTDGSQPQCTLISDSAGNLYGTTTYGGSAPGSDKGGAGGYGVVFKLDPSGQETVLYTFTGGADGGNPLAGLVRDSVGNLYGTASIGGSFGEGVVYKVDTSGHEAVLYNFTGGWDGGLPVGSLIRDSLGNLYGTTECGPIAENQCNWGGVYKLDPSGRITVLYNFTSGNDGGGPLSGAIPYSGPFLDSSGNVYGTTLAGGSGANSEDYAYGVVYKVDTFGHETVLYSFTGVPDGADPAAALIQDPAGNLYGTTEYGGEFNGGTVFKIAASPSPIEISPSFLVFPTAGSTLPVTVTNSGATPVSITFPPAFTGFDSFDFPVTSGTTCTNGSNIASGGSCVINVAFTPFTTSAESADLYIFDSASDSPQIVQLSGGAPLTTISPNPISGSKNAQPVTLTGTGFEAGATINWQDLTGGGSGTVTPLSVTPNQITASMNFTTATAAWQIQVANPTGTPSNWFSFEVLNSQYDYVLDDYPFQNATVDTADPYGFLIGIRECTSYVAWRMNRDAGTTNPAYPYFFNKMDGQRWGNASNWNANALALGYKVVPAVDQVPQVGAIAQWVNDCGGTCANGHVAYVEQVNSDGSFVISEYNFPDEPLLNIDHRFNVRTISSASRFPPQNFIYVPSLTLSTNLLDFGVQTVGSNYSYLSMFVTNPTSVTIPIASIQLEGLDKGNFGFTSYCGASVAPGAVCEIDVDFLQMMKGPSSALLKIEATVGPTITETIKLTGVGI
jgi:uncharacterized repeat protein (TIGR03803 family)